MANKRYLLVSILIIIFFIFIDQLLKIWVKTHFALGESVSVFGNWFFLHFIENEGMAFGLSFGNQIGKFLLTLFRIIISIFIFIYLIKQIKKSKIDWLGVSILSLIIAGAFGNIIDSLFYGLIFSESTPFAVATLFPATGGYAPFFYGKVVDMFDFNLFPLPHWIPFFGGGYFFPAIFNIADSCITVGIILLIIFNKRFFNS